MRKPANILLVQSSGRRAGSATRRLAEDIAADIAARAPGGRIVRRDLADGVPFVDEAWIDAAFTPPEKRSAEQTAQLAYSETLIREIEDAEILVIGAPMYNYGMPASLKAWIDQIARARRTFQYTEKGPVGMLAGRKAILVQATGGVPSGSPADHLSGHLKQALGLVGITETATVSADGLAANAEAGLARARAAASEAVAFATGLVAA